MRLEEELMANIHYDAFLEVVGCKERELGCECQKELQEKTNNKW